MHTLTEIILRMQPYSSELLKMCELNPDFTKALKTTHPDKFISLNAIIVSYSPLFPNDKVIGFIVYDYGNNPRFKQDFIVDIGSKGKEFILYTKYSDVQKSKMIQDISHFYQKYSTYPPSSHHPRIQDLPFEFRERAKNAIKLAEKIKRNGLREELTDEEYNKWDLDLKSLNL